MTGHRPTRTLVALVLLAAITAAAAGGRAAASGPAVITLRAAPTAGGSLTAADLDRAVAATRAQLAGLGLDATVTQAAPDGVVVRLAATAPPARAVAAVLTQPSGLEIYDLASSLPRPPTTLAALLRGGLLPSATVVTCSGSFAVACPGVLMDPPRGVTYFYAFRQHAALTAADLDAASTAAARDPSTGLPVVTLRLTARGNGLFHALTRTEARRGSRLGVLQSLAIVVAGELRAFPTIDYRAYPNGIAPGGEGITITGMRSLVEAKALAAALRSGPLPVRLSLAGIRAA